MFTRIVSYLMLGMCVFAFFLAILGVTHIGFGNDYYGFLRNVSVRFDSWRLEIPQIPKIPTQSFDSFDDSGVILTVLIKIGKFFVNVINGLVGILNLLINVTNIVIQLIQFFLTLIYSFKDFIGQLGTKFGNG